MGKIKEWATQNVDEKVLFRATQEARTKPDVLKRWMDYCQVDCPENIDYENPMVKIEFFLLDFTLYNIALDDPKLFCDTTNCDYDVFMSEFQPLPTREERGKELKSQMKRKLNPLKKHNKNKH